MCRFTVYGIVYAVRVHRIFTVSSKHANGHLSSRKLRFGPLSTVRLNGASSLSLDAHGSRRHRQADQDTSTHYSSNRPSRASKAMLGSIDARAGWSRVKVAPMELADNVTYRRLATVPGIGARTASELVIGVDIALLDGHGRLAPCCGLAPKDRQVRDLHIVDHGIRAGRQEAREPARILVQPDNPQRQPLRAVPPHAPRRTAHAARQGAEGDRTETREGDMRDNASLGPVRGLGGRSQQRPLHDPPCGRDGAARPMTHGNTQNPT